MKKAGRIIHKLLPKGLLVVSVLVLLLMAADLYHPLFSDRYTARGGAPALPELHGLAADSLLNSGDLDALDELPGIGEVLAQRIIETRERDGLFYFPEDIMSVSGIGEKRFADIMAFIAAQEATSTDLPAAP